MVLATLLIEGHGAETACGGMYSSMRLGCSGAAADALRDAARSRRLPLGMRAGLYLIKRSNHLFFFQGERAMMLVI